MTAEEIRDRDVYDVDYEATQLSFLREIAAQLAELNQKLTKSEPERFSANLSGPTLPDPGISYRRRK